MQAFRCKTFAKHSTIGNCTAATCLTKHIVLAFIDFKYQRWVFHNFRSIKKDIFQWDWQKTTQKLQIYKAEIFFLEQSLHYLVNINSITLTDCCIANVQFVYVIVVRNRSFVNNVRVFSLPFSMCLSYFTRNFIICHFRHRFSEQQRGCVHSS